MPDVLRQLHEQGGDKVHRTILAPDGALMHISGIENEVEWLLPAIATLCERDSQLAQVYLCHPAAKHVFKLPKEGNFCGYRNIQMLVSYIISAPAEGQQHFDSRIPHVLQIQDQIEAGWTMGINSFCRTETGGIKGTRKYIGTSEAQTYFTSLGIPSKVEAFSAMPPIPAHEFLFESIRAYFMADDGQGTAHGTQAVVRKTYKPPVYFQHHGMYYEMRRVDHKLTSNPGHSMTIIGYEKRKDNSQCLLVFDPSCRTVKAMTDLVNTGQFRGSASTLLRLYRRGVSYLRKHDEFEILMLAPSPQSDANDHSGSAES